MVEKKKYSTKMFCHLEKCKRQYGCGGVDSSRAKAAIERREKMEKKTRKVQEALQETKTNNQVLSEALVSVKKQQINIQKKQYLV